MRMIDADALIEFCAERWIPLNIDAVNMQPTIQPEKAQLSQEGTTSDLISKTEAVEHLRRMLEATVPNTDYDEGFVDGVQFAISTVSTMPTVQPVATDTNVGDAISRRAAIDAVEKNACNTQRIMDAVNNLPPAQPEPQWIPVERELPEPIIDVWVNSDLGQTVGYYDEMANLWYGRDYLELIVNAWMPLPEPYKPNK